MSLFLAWRAIHPALQARAARRNQSTSTAAVRFGFSDDNQNPGKCFRSFVMET